MIDLYAAALDWEAVFERLSMLGELADVSETISRLQETRGSANS